MHYLMLLAAGSMAGFINSIVGAGSFFSMPVLLLCGLSAKTAVATNRFSLIFLALAGMITFYRNNVLLFRPTLPLALCAGAGALLGAQLVIRINEAIMENLVLLLLIIIFAGYCLPPRWQPSFTPNRSRLRWLCFPLLFFIGIYGGFFGVGITVFHVSVLTFFMTMPLIEAMAANQLIVLIISLVASAVFSQDNLIDYRLSLPLAFGMALGSWLTTRYMITVNAGRLKKIFLVALGIMLVISIVKFKILT